MLALGGGVIGDMTGFAAATWLRGIGVVQVPTTLLAMVDASIGGKTGVNHPGGKNLIGAFHQPRLVLIDPATLQTLPTREFRAGMAEVIKYGILGDQELFTLLEHCQQPDQPEGLGTALLETILERSAAAKARVVAADEKEGGLRAILNYGHTFGHVVETLCGYGTWLHGEAVAIGMVAVGELVVQRGSWSRDDANRQRRLIQRTDSLPCGRTWILTASCDARRGTKKCATDAPFRPADRDRNGRNPRRHQPGGDPAVCRNCKAERPLRDVPSIEQPAELAQQVGIHKTQQCLLR